MTAMDLPDKKGRVMIAPSLVNDTYRKLFALMARKPSSLMLRQRGEAARLRKPRKKHRQ